MSPRAKWLYCAHSQVYGWVPTPRFGTAVRTGRFTRSWRPIMATSPAWASVPSRSHHRSSTGHPGPRVRVPPSSVSVIAGLQQLLVGRQELHRSGSDSVFI